MANALWFKTWHHSTNKESVPPPGIDFKLSEKELEAQTALAEKGDVYAMEKLWLYYGVYMEDLPQFKYWERKIIEAAKAGNQKARNLLPSWESYDSWANS